MGSLSQLHPIPLGLAVAPPAGPCQRPNGGGGESVQGLAGMRGGLLAAASSPLLPIPCLDGGCIPLPPVHLTSGGGSYRISPVPG